MITGMLRIMRVPCSLAQESSWVVTDLAAVAHVVCAIGCGDVSAFYVFCMSHRVDRQDPGLSVVYLSEEEPRCMQSVLACGMKKTESATKAALYLQ